MMSPMGPPHVFDWMSDEAIERTLRSLISISPNISLSTNKQTTTKGTAMSLDQAAQRTGGRWTKLEAVGSQIVGTLLDINTDKNRTDPDGNVVMSKKSGQVRKVFGLLVQTEAKEDGDDDGKRRFDANESAQYAIIDAFKEWRKENPSGEPVGCEFYLRVVEAAKDSFSQMGYKAKFGKRVMEPAMALDAAAAPAGPAYDEEPF